MAGVCVRNRGSRDGAVRVSIAPSQVHGLFLLPEVPEVFFVSPQPPGRDSVYRRQTPAVLLLGDNNLFR
jgi:hypothetical protein